jgi:hypothetical protein
VADDRKALRLSMTAIQPHHIMLQSMIRKSGRSDASSPTIRARAGQRSATIQDKWFARLFLLKPLVIASLVLFWVMSGFIPGDDGDSSLRMAFRLPWQRHLPQLPV